jgi:hypothetical protein
VTRAALHGGTPSVWSPHSYANISFREKYYQCAVLSSKNLGQTRPRLHCTTKVSLRTSHRAPPGTRPQHWAHRRCPAAAVPQKPMAIMARRLCPTRWALRREGMDAVATRGRSLRLAWYKQIPRSLRRNELPVKLIDRALLMPHEYLAGSPVELLEGTETAPRSNSVLHHPPEAFDRIEVVATTGW